MEIKVYLLSLVFVFLYSSCTNEKQVVQGVWEIKKSDQNSKFKPPFKKILEADYPWDYRECIYITNDLIEYPLGFKKGENALSNIFLEYMTLGNYIFAKEQKIKLSKGELCIRKNCFTKIDVILNKVSYVEFIGLIFKV